MIWGFDITLFVPTILFVFWKLVAYTTVVLVYVSLMSMALCIFVVCYSNRKAMLQNQQLPNCLHLLKEMICSLVNMVMLSNACSNCHLKDNCGYSMVYHANLFQFFCQCIHLLRNATSCFRSLLVRFKIFWFLEERKMLYNVLRRVSCGVLPLFLLHNLVIKLVYKYLTCFWLMKLSVLCWPLYISLF